MASFLQSNIFIGCVCLACIAIILHMYNHGKMFDMKFEGMEMVSGTSANDGGTMNQLTSKNDAAPLMPSATDATTTTPDKISASMSDSPSSSLLPIDNNSAWSEVNPQLNASSTGESTFLPNDMLIGKLSSTKKNPSYDMRRTPMVERNDASIPWNLSSIDVGTNDGNLMQMC